MLTRGSAAVAADARDYRYVHLDVFTDVRLAGNQLLVFPGPAGLDADVMLALTRESNYSECTFVFPPEESGVDHRVRIFTRTAETPFAGHPTIGTAFALAHVGVLKPSMATTTFGLGVGPTKIDLEWKGGALAFAWMTQLKPTFGKTIEDRAALASAVGVAADQLAAPAPQEVNCGSTFLIVPLTTRQAVDAAVLDRAKLDAVLTAAGLQRRGVYVFTADASSASLSGERAPSLSGERAPSLSGERSPSLSSERPPSVSGERSAYSRLLGTGGIEDPATGSAAGPAGSFAVRHKMFGDAAARDIVFLQGVLVRRPSRIHVRVAGTADNITSVHVVGSAVVVGEGTMKP